MINDVPPGDFLFYVRKLGVKPVTNLLHVEAGDTLRIAFTMEPVVTALGTVNITEAVRSPKMREFDDRRRGGVGQFLEGNILTPKLVGDSVGLHPVWLMFSLFAFGSLFGFTGLVLAVPVGAYLAVLVALAAFVLHPPLLGWIGVALTGSDTSANALFGQRFAPAFKCCARTIEILLRSEHFIGCGIQRLLACRRPAAGRRPGC